MRTMVTPGRIAILAAVLLAFSVPMLTPMPAAAWWAHPPGWGWHAGWGWHGGWGPGWHPGWRAGYYPGWGYGWRGWRGPYLVPGYYR